MFEESEIAALVLAVLLGLPIVFLTKAIRAPVHLLVAAVIAAMAATVFTVVEDIALGRLFNLLEHTCHALAGLLAAAGCWRLVLWSRRSEGESP